MNEITRRGANVLVKEGSISFQNFDAMEKEITEIARQVKEIEVNDETVKVAKKKVAEVRKGIQTLEGMRKEIKNRVLAPYQSFEKQIKQLVGIVDEADEYVRVQIRGLEEKEREQKRQEITEIWDKRNRQYGFTWLTVESFLKPNHMNKTTSMNKVEEEMAQWFEQTQRSIDVINSLPDAVETLAEYKKTGDLSIAIETVNQRKKEIDKIREAEETMETRNPPKVEIAINHNDLSKVVKLLQENKIEFEMK